MKRIRVVEIPWTIENATKYRLGGSIICRDILRNPDLNGIILIGGEK